MSTTTNQKELLIGVILYDGVMTLDWVGPSSYLELLPIFGVPVRFITISNKQGRIQDNNKVTLHAITHYAEAPQKLDILVIPGGHGDRQVMKDQGFLDFIKKAADSATHVLSVCTGSYLLAAAGALEGRRATTNKMAFTGVAKAYPTTEWVRQARWVVDGKWWTGSGVAAGLDMGHAFISHVHGKEKADEMARFMEIVPNTDPSDDPFVSSISTDGNGKLDEMARNLETAASAEP